MSTPITGSSEGSQGSPTRPPRADPPAGETTATGAATGAATEANLQRTLEALATAVQAGVPIHALLANAAATAPMPPAIVDALHRSAAQGVPLSETLFETGLFRPHERAILHAAERTGNVDVGLQTLAAAIKSRVAQRRKLLAGVAFPILLLVAASLILPLPLIFTDCLSAYLMRAFWLPALLISGMVYLFWWLPRRPINSPARAWPRRLASRLPFVRAAARSAELGEYCNVLGTTLGAGIPVEEALWSATQAVESRALRKTRAAILGRIRRGARLAEAMQETGAFDATMIGIVAQGELVGTVSDSLLSLGVSYADEAQRRFKRILLVTIAVIYAGVVLFIGSRIVSGFTEVLSTMERSMDFE